MMEATIDGYTHERPLRDLRRVYSVEATFAPMERCFHRYKTGGELTTTWVACSCQLAPRWDEPNGSENTEKNAA